MRFRQLWLVARADANDIAGNGQPGSRRHAARPPHRPRYLRCLQFVIVGDCIADQRYWEQPPVAQLTVRNLPDELVRALKQRAAKHKRSAEQEHREILKAALRGVRRRPLSDVLASIPKVGRDSDFEREQSDQGLS